ncbi:MAG: ATP-binding cassette domain-containing protein [Pseudomonadota bacterium]
MTAQQPILSLSHKGLVRNQNTILDDINLSIFAGEITSIIGPNGAGKTSLLRVILGLEQSTQGTVTLAPNCRVAYMQQKFEINPHLPISTHAFLALNKTTLTLDEQTALFKRVDISRILSTPLSKLSGGELQRVLLARALLKQPQLLILDEPTQGVDVHGQAELYELIEEIRNTLQCAIVMVSHELHIVMAKTDSIICLNQHICCQGRPKEVSQDPAYTALFGAAHAETLGVYSHQHDHHHDTHGHTHPGACSHD